MLHTTILSRLREMPETRRYWVAYSGGMDSHGLLDAMARLGGDLEGAGISAIHVNHRLQPEADRWARHASAVCDNLGIACRVLMADARAAPGESPEAAARRARYGVIKEIVGADEILLTAHHLDDQAETLFLQMVRGAGPRGLAGMPGVARFGAGWLGRPLLGVPRRVLGEYARSRGLSWIEDGSNGDYRFDRNYLRHEILPRLRDRWPGITRTLGRVAAHQADIARQLEELATSDLEDPHGDDHMEPLVTPVCERGREAPDIAARSALHGGTLSCDRLRRLPEYRQRNVLTAWFRRLGLPIPNAIHIRQILVEVVGAAPDREPLVGWKGAQVRRYRDNLYASPPPLAHDPAQVIHWSLDEPLFLSHGGLKARRVLGTGLRAAACPGDRVEVRFRRGGECCRLMARGHARSLKKLFQERGVVPWARDRNPLIFVAGELAAVAGLWVCHPFAANRDEPGWALQWTPIISR
uniref:tRNA(Ile)-lysidine synthase n=1 Tax=Candidatus Kentrum eta TaxID=2126337 RepID=A0A450UD53_9GAMM|nr:MAG: tRNA(Ile)-lysidine synthase [Candidatus Kentron sp. H]VFJ90241.1 MAG: tRNA(Ile)-lysidine synthase [Candidatus Kentron sp. H]VFJ96598.1 MAG: tRNA(Ile)-lysidine synthase [Candidatus Kentron sp. H]